MERFVHVSTHIEKTAGTSLQEFYARYYGPKRVYIYSSGTDSLICADRFLMRARVNLIADRLRTISKQFGLTALAHSFVINHLSNRSLGGMQKKIPTNCSVIHGHFVADSFDDVISNPFRTVILRDPLDRMLSHFKYWKEAKGVTNHRIDIPFDGKMTFNDFQSAQCLQNFQSSALGNLSIRDFDLVGVTQNLPNFISEFTRKCPIEGRAVGGELKKLNASPKRTDYAQFGIDAHFMKAFKHNNELDYFNYNCALEMNGLVH